MSVPEQRYLQIGMKQNRSFPIRPGRVLSHSGREPQLACFSSSTVWRRKLDLQASINVGIAIPADLQHLPFAAPVEGGKGTMSARPYPPWLRVLEWLE